MVQTNFEGVRPPAGPIAQVPRPRDLHLPMLVFDAGPGSVEKLPHFHRLLCPAPGPHSKYMYYSTNARISKFKRCEMHLTTHFQDLSLKDASHNA